jgi:Domain of unknown function (DUF1924)
MPEAHAMKRAGWALPGAPLIALALLASAALAGGGREAILAGLAATARQADPGFAGFSAERGRQFFLAQHVEGKIDTPSCTTCHTRDPTVPGRTRALKPIAPMAVSKTPDRFTDPAKVDKWFYRNCMSVLGRECTAVEKGDFIAYLAGL